MKTSITIVSMLLSLALGVLFDRLFLPPPIYVHQWMPIKLVTEDFGPLLGLTRKGDTYTRFAKLDGAWGITAVQQGNGIWVVPCQELGPKMSGGMR